MKFLIKIASILCIFISYASKADEWSEPVKITSMRSTSVSVTPAISIEGTCVSNVTAYLDPNQDRYKESISLILSAMMADKSVKLLCAESCASTNRCRIVDTEIIK